MSATVYLETFGCQMNVADSERAIVRLRAAGFGFADSSESADVVIFNTCSVRERAAHKVFTRIGEVRRLNNDPLIGVMGCSKPRTPHRLYASTDALALDTVVLRHTGLKNPRESDLVNAACHWFGSSASQPEVRGKDGPIAWHGPYDDELSAFFSLLSFPVYVLASGRGALFVPAMDKNAFPPLGREGLVLRFCRRAAQLILGLHPPK